MPDATALAVAAGLSSAALYGVSDFAGGIASKSDPATKVVALEDAGGAALLALAAALAGEAAPSAADAGWGAAAGLGLCVGAFGLYRGLAIGPMSLSAPIAAVTGAVVPVAAQVAGGEALSARRAAGLALALAGLALVSRSGGSRSDASGRGGPALAALGGLGFGLAFAALARTSPGALLWPLVVGRGASGLLMGAAALRAGMGLRPRAPAAILAVVAFGAAGNALYVAAVHTGAVVVAVLCSSMYPASTVLLALALLRERPSRSQYAGLAATVAAVALIA